MTLVSVEEAKAALEEVNLPTGSGGIGDTEIMAAIADVTAQLEDACGVAFAERTVTEQVEGVEGWALLRPRVIKVSKIDGENADLGPYPDGRIPLADGRHTVTYTHGWETTPRRIKRAVLLLVRHQLNIDPTDWDSRATHKVTDMASWSLITPGVRGAVTPIPEVNQIIADYAYAGDVV